MTSRFPGSRIRILRDIEPNGLGKFVLYWMIASRRFRDNFALDRAVSWCTSLKKPLVIVEGLRCDYPWASDRIHRFYLEGIRSNSEYADSYGVTYLPIVEKSIGQELESIRLYSKQASVVVTDDFPSRFHQERVETGCRVSGCRFETVDSNGLLPIRSAPKTFLRAFSFRQFLKKELLVHLAEFPQENPLERLSSEISRKVVLPVKLNCNEDLNTPLSKQPIDHTAIPVKRFFGGCTEAQKRLNLFLGKKLSRYLTDRNQPELDVTSGLSPYFHSGHISPHTVFRAISNREAWSPEKICADKRGKSWLGFSENAESFLDEMITWRELGYNMAWRQQDYDRYESLPQWAQRTLQDHSTDPRSKIYSLEEFENAQTHDPLWNAAQNQLREEGIIQNYLRMVWGKKILEWSRTPQESLKTMIHLNNKYALDGRNPNSYSGIFWVLGRYDRAWGPERPIFGKIRYMSSENTARKLRVKSYIQRYRQTDLV